MDRFLLCQRPFIRISVTIITFSNRTPYKENERDLPLKLSIASDHLGFQMCYLKSLLSTNFHTFQIWVMMVVFLR